MTTIRGDGLIHHKGGLQTDGYIHINARFRNYQYLDGGMQSYRERNAFTIDGRYSDNSVKTMVLLFF
jgi:hypothetical protein